LPKLPNRNEGKWTLRGLPQNSPFGEILGRSPKGHFKGSHKSVLSGPSQGSPQRVVQRVTLNWSLRGTEIFKIIFRLHNKFTHPIFHINSRNLKNSQNENMKWRFTQNADTSYFKKSFYFYKKNIKISLKFQTIIFSSILIVPFRANQGLVKDRPALALRGRCSKEFFKFRPLL
jgi:hypothetical protein